MNEQIIIYQVDAFTTEPFKGNPAGVCILKNERSESWMQNIAAELHASETAFLTGGGNNYRIRFFTPEAEVPLCGHATLSSAHIIYENGLAGISEEISFLSAAGELKIRFSEGWIVMNFPAYNVIPVENASDISKYIGIVPSELYRTSHGWILALLGSETELLNLDPDFRAMKSSQYGDLIVTSPSDDPGYDFCVRCFAPALGIDEDPVTGSAHCALATFWHKKTGKTDFVSHQISKRGGLLRVSLIGERVEISGKAKTLFRAELLV